MENFSDYLADTEKSELEAEMEKLRQVLEKENVTGDEIKTAHETFAKITMDKFAAAYNKQAQKSSSNTKENK